MSKSKVKCLLVCFFDSMGIVHKEWGPAGHTINITTKTFLKDPERVIWIHPNIATNWILQHDNAPAHAAFSVAQFLTLKGITVMPQPPHSPDLTPCVFLFQKAKLTMKGQHLESTEDIQRSVTQALNNIPHAAFQECYKQ